MKVHPARAYEPDEGVGVGNSTSDLIINELFKAAPIGIALIDQSLRFVWVNDALCHILGYSRDEFMDLEVTQISHPDTMNEDVRERFMLGELAQVTLEKRQITKEGDTKWVHINACVFRPGERDDEYGALFVEDISDRVRAQHELARRTTEAINLLSTLTSRERELLQFLTAGNTFNQIAEALFISKRTVESHVAAAYRKLGVSGREDAVRKVAELQSLIDIRTAVAETEPGSA